VGIHAIPWRSIYYRNAFSKKIPAVEKPGFLAPFDMEKG